MRLVPEDSLNLVSVVSECVAALSNLPALSLSLTLDSDRCRYLKAVPVLSEEQRANFNQLELVMTKEFISQQLIHLIGCLDTDEEGGR